MVLYTIGSKVAGIETPTVTVSATNNYLLFVNTYNPASGSGLIDYTKFYVSYDLYYDSTSEKYIEPYYKICSVYYNGSDYVVRDSSSWYGNNQWDGYFTPTEYTITGLSITCYDGDYIGIMFDFTSTGGSNETCIIPTPNSGTNYGRYNTASSELTTWVLGSYPVDGELYLYGELVEDTSGSTGENPIGGGIGGSPKQSCHTDDGTYEVGESTQDTWGVLQPQDFGTSGGEDAVYVDMVFPWDESGEWQQDEVLIHNTTETFDNPDDSTEHVSYKVQLFIGSPSVMYDIYECWWKESETGDVYVATYGSDSNFGTYWDDAYKTLTKGTTEVDDGRFVNIDEGIYASETDAFPDGKSYNFELRSVQQTVGELGATTVTSHTSSSDDYVAITKHQRVAASGMLKSFTLSKYYSYDFDVRLNIYSTDSPNDKELVYIKSTNWYNVPATSTPNYTTETIDVSGENISVNGGEVIGLALRSTGGNWGIQQCEYDYYDYTGLVSGSSGDVTLLESDRSRDTLVYYSTIEYNEPNKIAITGDSSTEIYNVSFGDVYGDAKVDTDHTSYKRTVIDENFLTTSSMNSIVGYKINVSRMGSSTYYSFYHRLCIFEDIGTKYSPVYKSNWQYTYGGNEYGLYVDGISGSPTLSSGYIIGIEIMSVSGNMVLNFDNQSTYTNDSFMYVGDTDEEFDKSSYEKTWSNIKLQMAVKYI